jgi:hypothetical protein|tara:strand:+ start:56 stop:202 length:147 start_codon:yes stop_codon:yes gene_type:complete
MSIFIIVIVSVLAGFGISKIFTGNTFDKKFVFCDKEQKWKLIDVSKKD